MCPSKWHPFLLARGFCGTECGVHRGWGTQIMGSRKCEEHRTWRTQSLGPQGAESPVFNHKVQATAHLWDQFCDSGACVSRVFRSPTQGLGHCRSRSLECTLHLQDAALAGLDLALSCLAALTLLCPALGLTIHLSRQYGSLHAGRVSVAFQ